MIVCGHHITIILTEDESEEEVDDWEGEPLGLEQCLFCQHIAGEIQEGQAGIIMTKGGLVG